MQALLYFRVLPTNAKYQINLLCHGLWHHCNWVVILFIAYTLHLFPAVRRLELMLTRVFPTQRIIISVLRESHLASEFTSGGFIKASSINITNSAELLTSDYIQIYLWVMTLK